MVPEHAFPAGATGQEGDGGATVEAGRRWGELVHYTRRGEAESELDSDRSRQETGGERGEPSGGGGGPALAE